jgi:hypothetical protein
VATRSSVGGAGAVVTAVVSVVVVVVAPSVRADSDGWSAVVVVSAMQAP